MTKRAWAVVVLGVAAVVVAALFTGLPRPLALAQMPMRPGGPMMGPQMMGLQAHLESMPRGMGMPGGMMMPPGGVPGQQPGGPGSAPRSVPAPPQIVPGGRTITITAVDFAFRPSEIRVPAGSAVNVVLINRGAIAHDLEIGALRFHLHAEPRAQVAGSLRDLAAGTYEFYCTIPGHREVGMRGRLVVTP